MTTSVLDSVEPSAPTFAVRPTSRQEVEAWEQLSALQTRLMDMFASAAPYMKAMETALSEFATNVDVRVKHLSDPDWKMVYPTVVLRYAIPGEWTPERFAARDAALQLWYDAPEHIRDAFPPLRERVTVQEPTLTLL